SAAARPGGGGRSSARGPGGHRRSDAGAPRAVSAVGGVRAGSGRAADGDGHGGDEAGDEERGTGEWLRGGDAHGFPSVEQPASRKLHATSVRLFRAPSPSDGGARGVTSEVTSPCRGRHARSPRSRCLARENRLTVRGVIVCAEGRGARIESVRRGRIAE